MRQRKALILTGVPGTGKSTIAKLVAEKAGLALIDINALVKERGIYSEIDEADEARVVVLSKLEQEANMELRKCKAGAVVEGHLACEIKLKPASAVIVCRTHPKKLSERLAKRGYSAEKAKANEMSEMLDYCTINACRNYPAKKVFEIDTTNATLEQNARECLEILKGGKGSQKYKPRINWADVLFEQEVKFR
jgi:adenylate kinase